MTKETESTLPYSLAMKVKLAKANGIKITPESAILDFGCGSGKGVKEIQKLNCIVSGCDISFKTELNIDTESMEKQGILKKIELNPYRLPYSDNTFDIIYSEDVFEHVRNYPETISEISRILKPDGICIHTFASRYKIMETHVFVPFASVIQSRWWLRLWIMLGFHNEWKDCDTVSKRTERYFNYLNENTNYLPKKKLVRLFSEGFATVSFCEGQFLKLSRPGSPVNSVLNMFPFLASIYSTLRMRVLLTGKPRKQSKFLS